MLIISMQGTTIWEYTNTYIHTLTISGFEAVNQPNGQVAFGSELSCFLPHVNHHLSKALPLIQLD